MDHAIAVLQQLGAINQEDEVTPLGHHLVRTVLLFEDLKFNMFPAVYVTSRPQTRQGECLYWTDLLSKLKFH